MSIAMNETNNTNEMGFEDAMKRLEEVLRELEGQAPLDKMLSLYEEGVMLVSRCNKILDTANEKILQIVKNGNGYSEEGFSSNE